MPVEPPIEIPRSLPEAYGLLAGSSLTPIAGGTDLMVRITGEIGPPPDHIIDLGHLEADRFPSAQGVAGLGRHHGAALHFDEAVASLDQP